MVHPPSPLTVWCVCVCVSYDNRCSHLRAEQVEDRLSQEVPHVVRFRLEPGVEPFQDLVFGWTRHEVAQVRQPGMEVDSITCVCVCVFYVCVCVCILRVCVCEPVVRVCVFHTCVCVCACRAKGASGPSWPSLCLS